MYAAGEGVPQDYSEAARWWRRAAEYAFDTGALHNLGVVHGKFSGGRSQDLVEAHKWFNLSATLDRRDAPERDAVAKSMLVAQVFEAQRLASEWWEQNGSNSISEPVDIGALIDDALSDVDARGLWPFDPPVQLDDISAHMWLSLAVAGGDESATSLRDNVASKMTQAQIAEALQLAREWQKKHSR
jgi:TPR repeat protein